MTDHDEHKKEIDQLSGVETTGHEWDGLKELNNPLPRWWLWVFYASVIWSLGYFILYPAWPTLSGATKGTLGYTQYKELAASQTEIVERQQNYMARFEKSSLEEILNDRELYAFAIAGGHAAFKENCATCHGTGAEGSKGYPNLNDDDWLWGGTVDDIHTTIAYGIRSDDQNARISQMPSFGKDGILKREEINQVVEYVLSLPKDPVISATLPGAAIYNTNCASCHGADGKGGRDFGAPNLADTIWLFGSEKAEISASISNAHAGVMPAWRTRLDPQTIRQLTVYVHQLGGGEKKAQSNPETTPITGNQIPTE